MHGVDKSKAMQDKKKPTSRSARAGLQFPVGRVHRLLKVRGQKGRDEESFAQRLSFGRLQAEDGCGLFFRSHRGAIHLVAAPWGAPLRSTMCAALFLPVNLRPDPPLFPSTTTNQTRVTANGRVGATAAVYTAAILGELARASLPDADRSLLVFYVHAHAAATMHAACTQHLPPPYPLLQPTCRVPHRRGAGAGR
jgi:hypothetical protein